MSYSAPVPGTGADVQACERVRALPVSASENAVTVARCPDGLRAMQRAPGAGWNFAMSG